MKYKVFGAALALVVLLAGCKAPAGSASPSPSQSADAVTTASIVDNEEAFSKAISSDGTWIVCLTQNIETEEELVLEGQFTNGRKDEDGNDVMQRKVALYAQDDDRNITERYTLMAPKLTINSPEASLQNGTFKGDIYVAATNFKLIGMEVDGSVYFENEQAQATFEIDANSSVSGVQELRT